MYEHASLGPVGEHITEPPNAALVSYYVLRIKYRPYRIRNNYMIIVSQTSLRKELETTICRQVVVAYLRH